MSPRRYFQLFLLCAPLCGAGPARAEIRDLLQLFQGARNGMPEAPQTVGESAPRQLLFNGAPLRMLIGRSPQTPRDVVEFYQRRCGAGLAREKSREPGSPGPQIMRQVGEGYAMMVDVAPFFRAAPLCMAYARRTADATDYMTVYSDGPLPKGVLSPSEREDAPGIDAPGIPRPHGGVRSFSLSEPAAGYVIVAYAMDDAPEVALRQAINQLATVGFTPDGSFAQAASQERRLMMRLERPGQDLVVSAQERRAASHGSLILYLARTR